MTSVTLDTNAYVSALEFGGMAAHFLPMAKMGELRIDASNAILDETIGVLRVKFGWDGYRLHFTRLNLLGLVNLVSPKSTINVVVDPDDNRILECAVEAGSDFIITADKDLLRLGSYAGIPITRTQDFFRRGMGSVGLRVSSIRPAILLRSRMAATGLHPS